MVKAKELKKGNKIIIDNVFITITNIETSKVAKHGKAKCRIEGVTKNKGKKVFITLADQEIRLES